VAFAVAQHSGDKNTQSSVICCHLWEEFVDVGVFFCVFFDDKGCFWGRFQVIWKVETWRATSLQQPKIFNKHNSQKRESIKRKTLPLQP